MAKGSGTTKYQGSSASSAAKATTGEFAFVRNHPFPPTEYINALNTVNKALKMKDDGEHIKVETPLGEIRDETVSRLGAVERNARILSYMGKEIQKGPIKLSDNFVDRGIITKVKGGYLYDSKDGFKVTTKTLEALERYLSPRADFKINGKWRWDI